MGANVVEVIDEASDVGAELGLPLPSLLEELFVCEALKQLVVNQRELPRQHLRLDLPTSPCHFHNLSKYMQHIFNNIAIYYYSKKSKCKYIYIFLLYILIYILNVVVGYLEQIQRLVLG
jgi:hypothetical protein